VWSILNTERLGKAARGHEIRNDTGYAIPSVNVFTKTITYIKLTIESKRSKYRPAFRHFQGKLIIPVYPVIVFTRQLILVLLLPILQNQFGDEIGIVAGVIRLMVEQEADRNGIDTTTVPVITEGCLVGVDAKRRPMPPIDHL